MEKLLCMLTVMILLVGCVPRTTGTSSSSEQEPQSSAVSERNSAASESSIVPVDEDALYEEMILIFGAQQEALEGKEPRIRPSHTSLFYGDDWESAEELSTGSYFSWFLSMLWRDELSDEEMAEKYKSPHGEDIGWFFPQIYFEPKVQQYFDVTTEHLRADDTVYDAKNEGYYIGTGGGIGMSPTLILGEVEKKDDLRILHIELRTDIEGMPSEFKLLIVRMLPDGGYQFEAYQTDKASSSAS